MKMVLRELLRLWDAEDGMEGSQPLHETNSELVVAAQFRALLPKN
jgi:hypothetical protein